MNPHDDGIGIDEYVDWLIEAGYPIERVEDFGEWVHRFHAGLAALPDKQRHNTVLQMLLIMLHSNHDLHAPEPSLGSFAPRTGSGLPCKPPTSAPTVTSRTSPRGHHQVRHRHATPGRARGVTARTGAGGRLRCRANRVA